MGTGEISLIGGFATGITVLVLIVWAVSILVNARTRRETQRLELHGRLLDRIGSTQEFAEFLATANGQRFLDAITPPATRPQWRLLWALIGGIVLVSVGIAAFLAGRRDIPVRPQRRIEYLCVGIQPTHSDEVIIEH